MALTFGNRIRLLGKAAVGVFSDKAQAEAYSMLAGIQPGAQGAPPPRGTAQYLEAYSQMPWLRAVASRVASAVAQTEWQLYVEKRRGAPKATRNRMIQRAGLSTRRKMIKTAQDRGDATQIEQHVLLDTIQNANSFQTGDAMWKVTQLHLDLVGEAFWIKERDGLGVVTGLWPVPPNWIMNTPTPTHPFFRVGFRSWRGLVPDTEILWFADPNPANPYGRGSGTAQALADELETDEYAAKHTKAFFYNRARPDIIVYPKAPQVMRPADAQRLEEDWVSRNQGFWRAFKPYFLSREVGIHESEQNFRSLQLVQLREFERDSIIQMFGMPPELLGVVENSNRATIDAADYLFSRYVVQPRLEFLRAVMQERLVPEYDERLIIDYVSPVQEDKELALKAAQAAPWALELDEWRERMGAERLGEDNGGKVHVFPNTVKPMSLERAVEMAEEPEPVELPPGEDPEDDPSGGEGGGRGPKPQGAPKPPAGQGTSVEDDEKAWRRSLREDAAICAAVGDADHATALVKFAVAGEEDELPAPTEVAARRERGFARRLLDAFRGLRAGADEAALERACGSGDAEAIEAALHLGGADALVRGIAMELVEAGFMAGAKLGLSVLIEQGANVRPAKADDDTVAISIDFEAVNPEAVAFARQYAAQLVAAPAVVRAEIRVLVTQSIALGIAPRDLARMLVAMIGLNERQAAAVQRFRQRLAEQGVGGEVLARRVERYSEALLRQRALTIARTELIRAVNAGQQALWRHAEQQGVLDDTMRRIWIVTMDERLEAECEAIGEASEANPVRMNEPFLNGHMAPPAHPNCRCAVGLVRAR